MKLQNLHMHCKREEKPDGRTSVIDCDYLECMWITSSSQYEDEAAWEIEGEACKIHNAEATYMLYATPGLMSKMAAPSA